MYEEHPVFSPPPPDAVLWRYMDFTKFVSILDKHALFFPAADKLGDPFEGSLPKINLEVRRAQFRQLIPTDDHHREQMIRNYPNWLKKHRCFTLISCWHENNHESEAMWRLYAREKDGIAIKTDFDSFKNSFTCSESIYIGKVSYIDYMRDWIPDGNTFYPFLHKRKSFMHEQEVRAISDRSHPQDEGYKKLRAEDLTGVYYEVDLSLLIKEVIVAPFAPDWFLELVKSVTARYNFNFPVVKSTQTDDPTWG